MKRARVFPFWARLFAWLCAVGGVCAVAFWFEHLPEQIPITRWSTLPKSPLLAFRVPAINLLSVALLDLLARAVRRARSGELAVAALLVTAGLKATLEWLELTFALPTALLTGLVVVVGIGVAALLGRDFWRAPRPPVPFTRGEEVLALTLFTLLVGFQILVPALS